MLKKFTQTVILIFGLTVLFTACPNEKSEVVEIDYPTRDYTVPATKLTENDYYNKHAFVYLPAGYDKMNKKKKYPLLILMHGSGENEYIWGLNDPNGELRVYLDNNINIKEFIVVTPSGVSDKTWNEKREWSSDAGANCFGQELRNDLLPYIRKNFNVSAKREDNAMAGLSMGSNQSMTIGIGECLDLFASFGCFGATPRANSIMTYIQPEKYVSDVDKKADDNLKIKYMFMTCGTEDEIFYPGYCSYVPVISKWDRIQNFACKEYPGLKHEWACWIQSFKDFGENLFKY